MSSVVDDILNGEEAEYVLLGVAENDMLSGDDGDDLRFSGPGLVAEMAWTCYAADCGGRGTTPPGDDAGALHLE